MTLPAPILPLDPWALALQGASLAANHHTEIQNLWDRTWAYVTNRNSKIVVTGLPGVGKSVLFDHIGGRAALLDYQLPDMSRVAEEQRLKQGDQRWVITIVPGQDTPVRAETLDSAFRRGKRVDGVIHVVADGFASLREATAERELIERGVSLDSYRAERKAAELGDFREVSQGIRAAMRRKKNKPRNPWLLVAVNKADLFSDDASRQAAYMHYAAHSGDFRAEVDRLLDSVGRDNLRVEIQPVASWAQDFSFGSEIVRSNMPQGVRNQTLFHFAQVMSALCRGV